MFINSEIINLGIPLAICLLSAIPFLLVPGLGKKEEESLSATYYLTIGYFLILGLGVLVLIIAQSIEVMGINNGNRALFVCAILIAACLDRLIDLSGARIFIKTNLINRLHYFVILLCSIPIIWQLLTHLVPAEISSKLNIMGGIEILLMLIMLVLGIINRPNKKVEIEPKS